MDSTAEVVVLPTMAAGVAGVLVGHRSLDRDETRKVRQAVWLGFVTSVIAGCIFVPLYTITYAAVALKGNILYLPAVMGMVGMFCLVIAGPFIAVIGAVAGW